MKKSMLRIASVLLVAVLLTTCIISGAFAKYVTNTESYAENARVAKWGITLAAIAADTDTTGFTKTYAADDEDTEIENTVVSTVEVLAPGTEGTFSSMQITDSGREVAVRAEIKANFELGANWTADGDYYCPVVVTVGSTEVDGADYDTADEFEQAVEAAIIAEFSGETYTYSEDDEADGKVTKTFDYETTDNLTKTVDLSWAWAFEQVDAADYDAADYDDDADAAADAYAADLKEYDRKDTALGTAANASIDLYYSIILTQID